MSIVVNKIYKEYITYKREKGFWKSLKSIFIRVKTSHLAVNNLEFDIHPGETVGYIGPNGAGKSTTIKMMCGILTPTKGKVVIDGVEPYRCRKKIAYKIGVVFGQRTQLMWDLPVEDSFRLMKEVYSIPEEKYKETYTKLVRLFSLQNFIETPVRQLSLGQRMRADIALALLHDPEILFLDEPTIGLDVTAKKVIRDQIKKFTDQGDKIVILTSHDMEDVESVCNRLIYVDNGTKYFDGTVEEFKRKYHQLRYVNFEFEDEIKQVDIPNLPNVNIEEWNSNKLKVSFDKKDIKAKEIVEVINKKFNITDFWIEDESIDEVVRRAYRLEKND